MCSYAQTAVCKDVLPPQKDVYLRLPGERAPYGVAMALPAPACCGCCCRETARGTSSPRVSLFPLKSASDDGAVLVDEGLPNSSPRSIAPTGTLDLPLISVPVMPPPVHAEDEARDEHRAKDSGDRFIFSKISKK